MNRMIESLAIPAIEWLADGTITDVNTQLCELTEYAREELLHQNVYAVLFPGELGDQWDQARVQFAIGQDVDRYATGIQPKSGGFKLISWATVIHCTPDGHLQSVLCMGLDFTVFSVAQGKLTRLARNIARTRAHLRRATGPH